MNIELRISNYVEIINSIFEYFNLPLSLNYDKNNNFINASLEGDYDDKDDFICSFLEYCEQDNILVKNSFNGLYSIDIPKFINIWEHYLQTFAYNVDTKKQIKKIITYLNKLDLTYEMYF